MKKFWSLLTGVFDFLVAWNEIDQALILIDMFCDSQ
jgi:hypothetical protein